MYPWQAQNISQYMNNQFNAYVWWWVYDTDTSLNLVDESGYIHKNGYTFGQFAKWIRPGSTKVTADYNPQASVNVTAYNAYANGGVVIVAVNANNNLVSQAFTIHNGNATLLEGYQTSTNNSMTDIGSFAVSGGSFTVNLPAQSITTFVQTNVIPANLPPTWAAQDVGPVGIVGSTTYTNTVGTNGVFRVTASGQRHLEHSRHVSVFVANQRRELHDYRSRELGAERKRDGQGRRDDPVQPGLECAQRVRGVDAWRRDFSIPFDHRRRHEFQPGERLDRALLGRAGAERQHVHGILFHGWRKLDAIWGRRRLAWVRWCIRDWRFATMATQVWARRCSTT